MIQEKLLYAQDLLKNAGSSVSSGFNMKITGHTISDLNDHYDRSNKFAGFMKAEQMIDNGEIYYTHRFKCNCGAFPFQYGGFWVCNDCGGNRCERDWWVIRVQKDGNAWCCIGLGFEDLQSSDNYAFGDTRQESIDEYEKLMRAKE